MPDSTIYSFLLLCYSLSSFLFFSFLIKNVGETRRPPPRACQQASKMVDYSLMMTDVDFDCIRRFANPKSVHARSCRLRLF